MLALFSRADMKAVLVPVEWYWEMPGGYYKTFHCDTKQGKKGNAFT